MRTFALVVAVAALADASPRVETENGAVVGFTRRGVDAFLGMRFAAAPTGALRFAPPAPAANWTGDRFSRRWGAGCLQPGSALVGGEGGWPSINLTDTAEDCLFVNVWAPQNRTKPLPVLFYLPSGEFRYGGANDYESNWPSFGAGDAAEPVIYVAANSRLGFLGYVALDELKAVNPAPGNIGLQDQRAALRWVKRNIAAFGGDPDRVTIFGESSGGTAVGFHLVSQKSAGLFNQAIFESPGLTQTKRWPQAEADALFAFAAVSATAKYADCGFADPPAWRRYVGFAGGGPSKATVNFTSYPGTLTVDAVAAAARRRCVELPTCFASYVNYDSGSGTWASTLLGGAEASEVSLTNLTFSFHPGVPFFLPRG